jgi:tight adherence protein B
MIPVIVTFAVIVGIVLIPYWLLVVRSEQVADRSLRKRMKVTKAKSLAQVDLLQAEQPLSNVGIVHRLLQRLSMVREPIHRQIVQSGVELTVGLVFLASIFLAVAMTALVYWASGMLLVALPIGVGAAFVPYMVVRFLASRRLWKFEEQFPEAVELIARALRAGHAFTTGLSMVADEMPDPVAAEFRLVYDRQAFGMQITDALRDMARRVPLLDARFFVTAVLTQRESGGNLAEVLDNLAALMRERFKVKRQVRTVSAHGRITGWVLTGMAPALAIVLVLLAPQHMSVLITDPLGRAMVAGALLLQVIGVFAIRRIINIEV